jgi:hypothetical protein
VVAAAAACGRLGPDLSPVIAIATAVPDSLEEDDTLIARATALDGAGNVVQATIHWTSLDSVLKVLLPDTAGWTVVSRPGLVGRLQASVGTLLSNPLTIRTFAAADSLFIAGRGADTVSLAVITDSLSRALTVEVADTVVTGTPPLTSIVPLAGRQVVFTLAYERMGDSVTLITTDTLAHARVTVDTVASDASGLAAVRVRFLGGTLPDTARVTASATRARGLPAPGSPATLVVTFQP